MSRHLVAFCLLLSLAGWAQAEILTLEPDADTYIRDASSYGSASHMYLHGGFNFVGYLRFDLSEYVIQSISSATLTLTVSGDAPRNDNPVNGRFILYGLDNVPGNTPQDWDEMLLTTDTVGAEYTTNGGEPLVNVTAMDEDVVTETITRAPGTNYWDPGATTITVSGDVLVDFILSRAQDGGLVTFLLEFPGDAGRGFGIASKDHAEADYHPRLELDVVLGTKTAATQPNPGDGQTDVYSKTDLSWSPGLYAASHTLYLSTDFDDVSGAQPAALAAEGLTETVFTPAEPLALGQTYYWRVDEVNAAPDSSVYPGAVWSFTVEPETYPVTGLTVAASSSDAERLAEHVIDGSGLTNGAHGKDGDTMWLTSPDDGERWIQFNFDRPYGLAAMTIWNYNGDFEVALGFGAQQIQVETSPDGQTWTALPAPIALTQAPGAAGYDTPDVVDMNGVMAQAVRLTILDNFNPGAVQVSGLSEVQFTYIPFQARVPEPADGAVAVPVDTTLTWRSGRNSALSRVYLSTDADAVLARDASTLWVETTDDETTPAGLLLDSTITWAVDSVRADTNEVVPGDLWSFSTPSVVWIDTMESYNDNEPTRIFDTWIDGWNDDNNGSQVGYAVAPFTESEVVYDGRQSMPFHYDTTGAATAAWADLDVSGQDWSAGGITELSLFFLGDRDNQAGQLFIEVDGHRVTRPGGLNSGLWTQWIVDLTSLGANLSQVQTLRLGVTGNQARGIVYIDDIALYRVAPRIAVAAPQDPGTTDLALYYAMENNLNDSSGNNLHGTPEPGLFYDQSLAAGNLQLGMAASFNGISDFVTVPAGPLVASLTDCTFAAWVNLTQDSGANWQRVFDFGMDTTSYLFLTPRSGTAGSPEFGILAPGSASGVEQDVAAAEPLTAGWHHLAVVLESGTMTLYVDGVVAGTDVTDTVPQDLGVTTNNWLGQSQWSGDDLYSGLMDEFRVYRRALSAGEVRYLAGDR